MVNLNKISHNSVRIFKFYHYEVFNFLQMLPFLFVNKFTSASQL